MRIALLFLTESNPFHKDALISQGYINNPECEIIIIPKKPEMVDPFWKIYLSKYLIDEWDDLSPTIAILLLLEQALEKNVDTFYICPEDLYPLKPYELYKKSYEEFFQTSGMKKDTSNISFFDYNSNLSDIPYNKYVKEDILTLLNNIKTSLIDDSVPKEEYSKYDEVLNKTSFLKELCYKNIFQDALKTLPTSTGTYLKPLLENYFFVYSFSLFGIQFKIGGIFTQIDKFLEKYNADFTKINKLIKGHISNDMAFIAYDEKEQNGSYFIINTLSTFTPNIIIPKQYAIILTICNKTYDYNNFLKKLNGKYDLYLFKCIEQENNTIDQKLLKECVRLYTIVQEKMNDYDEEMIFELIPQNKLYNNGKNIFFIKDNENPSDKIDEINKKKLGLTNNVNTIDQKVYNTLEYGSVIKIISSDESIYDNRYFMVDKITDEELILLERNGKTLSLTFPLNNVMQISVVYLPEIKGYIKQNNILVNSWVNIEFIDNSKYKGKVLEADNNIIHIQIPNKADIYIPVHYGLPKEVLSITKTIAPKMISEEIEPEIITDNVRKILEEAKEEQELGEIDVDFEDSTIQLFFSLEQQTDDLLENLLIPIEENKRTITFMKKLFHIIRRYVEMRDKYTIFENGIKRLEYPSDPYLKNIKENKNGLLIPISNKTYVHKYVNGKDLINVAFSISTGKETIETYQQNNPDSVFAVHDQIDGIFKNKGIESVDSNLKILTYDTKELKKISVKDLDDLYDLFTNNVDIDLRYKKEKEIYYHGSNKKLVYLNNNNILYPLNIDKSFVINYFMTRPENYLKHYNANAINSYILDKSVYSKYPYFDFLFSNRQINVNGNIKNNKLFGDKIQIFKNKENSLEKYFDDFIPSFETFLKDYVDKSFMNYSDAIKELQKINVDEYNENIFKIITSYITKNINKYIEDEKIERDKNLHTTNIKHNLYNNKKQINNILINSIFENYPLLNKDEFYSPSEIMYTGLIDTYQYYAVQYIKNNFELQLVNNEHIEEFINEINKDFESVMSNEEKIHKTYKLEQERENDNYKKIILQDIKREGNNKQMNAIEFFYQDLLRKNLLNEINFEEFMDKINNILKNGLDSIADEFKDDNISHYIAENITKYMIITNNIAIVEETNKKYRWNGEKWIDADDSISCIRKKIISLKTNNSDNECENKNKSEEYEKKIKGIILDIQSELKRKEELIKLSLENPNNKKKQIYYINQKRLNDMTYNSLYNYYLNLELQKESNLIKSSPYKPLFERIMKEPNLTNKYKAIQLFIANYTKTNNNEEYWFLCVETNVKLIPKFLLRMADAYLITNNYTQEIDKLCLEQGVLSDDGAFFVDKYSGYIIKEISLNEDTGYNDKGGKNIYHTVIEEEDDNNISLEDENGEQNKFDVIDKYEEKVVKTELEIKIRNAAFYLLNMMGIMMVNKNETMDELYEVIKTSYEMVLEDNLKKLEKSKDLSPDQKFKLYIYSVISNCLVFSQTADENKIRFIVSYPGCKKSFDGFPINNDNTHGIEYVACIVEEIKKTNKMWSDALDKKATKESKDKMIIIIKNFITKYIITLKSIKTKIYEAKERIVKLKTIENSSYSKWELFSPRLEPIQINMDNLDSLTVQDKIKVFSFMIQQKINEHVSKQKPLRTNNFGNPLQINSCCDKNKNVIDYFIEHSGIDKEIKQLYYLNDELNEIKKFSQLERLYSYKNTKRVLTEVSSNIDEKTIYTGIIKWFLLDENLPPMDQLQKYNITKPENYRKTDTLEEKIVKLKEDGKLISSNEFLEIAKDVAKINNSIIINKNVSELDTTETEIKVKTKLIELIESNNTRNIKDYCYQMREDKTNDMMRNIKTANGKALQKALKFYEVFHSDKKNPLLPDGLEHYNYLNQILSNKISLLLKVFPNIINTKRPYFKSTLPMHWKLNDNHKVNMQKNIDNFYEPIKTFMQSSRTDKFHQIIESIDFGEENYIFNLNIKDQELKFMIYSYLFISILHKYYSTNEKIMIEYIKTAISYFLKEDKSLNYDSKLISFEVNLAKKSESEIKTTHLKKMGKELRRSENQLKNLKLGDWASGLNKSVYKYVADEYDKVLNEAIQIKDAYAPEDTGEYDLNYLDDGEVQEGLTGDEW